MLGKMLRKLLIAILVPIGLIVLGLGYLGFVPGVSALFGSNHPVDLGLPATEADRLSANEKFHQTIVDRGTGSGVDILKAGGTHDIDATLTPQESAAHLMQMHPFTDLQVRINSDETFEAAGKVDTSRIAGYLQAFGLTTVNGLDVLKTIDKYLVGQPTIYVKGTGSIAQDQVALSLTSAKLGRLSLGAKQFGQGLTEYVEAIMKNVPGLDVTSLVVENGQAHFIGQVPATIPKY